MKNIRLYLTIFFIFFLFFKNIFSGEILTPSQIRFTGKDAKIGNFLEVENKKFRYFLTGQVAVAGSYDSSRYFGLVQDAVIFYPLAQKLDSTGLNVNDKDQSDMFALNAGIKTLFVGPDIWKAKILGRFEIGFVGIKNNISGIMNLASAYVSFIWKNTEMRFGHFYHPLALENLYPTPISGSEGLGYDPSRRVPYLRFSHRIDKVNFILAISKIFDVTASTRAAMPDVFGQANLKISDDYTLGAGANFHSEVPQLQTNKGYKTTQSVNAIALFAYARLVFMNFLLKTRFTYIENGNNFGVMGTYGVVSENSVTGERIYTPMRAAAAWAEMVFIKSKFIEPAIFIGFTKNLGASRQVLKCDPSLEGDACVSLLNIDSLTPGMQYMFQLSPRVRLQVKDFIFGFEMGYYRAAFARDSDKLDWQSDYDCYGKVISAKPSADVRLIFSSVYTF